MSRFVKVLLCLMHQEVVDFFVRGSNSRFLSTDIVAEFRGRSQEIHMLSLTFAEYLSAFDDTEYEAWIDYIDVGELPQILSFKARQHKITYLSNLIETNSIFQRYSRAK